LQGWLQLDSKERRESNWRRFCSSTAFVAGVAPVWAAAPAARRLGGYFLYAALGIGALGLIVGGGTMRNIRPSADSTLLIGKAAGRTVSDLFITIACGAALDFTR